jgi:NADP-dependent aldehyde dehydrogenase
MITARPELDHALAAADEAAEEFAHSTPSTRAGRLRAVADALDAEAGTLVPLAHRETHLPENPRLSGELARTSFQLRLFAEVLVDGAWLDATVDHADPGWPMGARPDIRRVRTAIGPVLVFAASNFPFAFSVAGGDTASALAAGCPVVLKAHPGHPRLGARTGDVVTAALRGAGAPDGGFAVVHGDDVGVAALRDPRIRAAAFTGSVRGGRALFDVANARPRPIPFYGELGSLNPVVVTRAAVEARGDEIAREFVASFTLGAGQFCTKPGLLLAPEGSDMAGHLDRAVAAASPAPLLGEWIAQGYAARVADLHQAGAETLVAAEGGDPSRPAPQLFGAPAARLLAEDTTLGEEVFGPASVLVTYRDEAELREVLLRLAPSLTVSVQAEQADVPAVSRLMPVLTRAAGRLLWNQWPTGVTVTWAQQHGGPYPATTAPTTTSVGTAAIERFLRPVAWQGFPDDLLPPALRESNPWSLPRRVDGSRAPED